MASNPYESFPTLAEIHDAAARIAPHAVVTPVLRDDLLDAMAGAQLHFKCENLQRGGAFKFRGACNAVWSLDDAAARRGVVTHSSGNHGNALALAAATRGMAAHVVVPEGAVQAKLDAIVQAGAILHRCEATQAAREAAALRVQVETGAELVHPYADRRVMAGQGTVVGELRYQAGPLDDLVVPVGGGGLAAGCTIAAQGSDPSPRVHLAEPAGADDTARSLERGERVAPFVPATLCDGLRTLVGEPNFAVLKSHAVDAIVVDDEEVIVAMKLLWSRLKIVVEPSSATVLAAVLKHRERFAGRRVGLVLSGGNVDLDHLPW